MNLKHIISARDFDKEFLTQIFKSAQNAKDKKIKGEPLKGKIMATLFYEPSTRTRLSFESAMIRLGGQVIGTENAAEFSSAAKGETLEDTIRNVHSYADVIVLRHYFDGASKIAASYSKVPIINSGDGSGEHPTQALYDLFTIFSKFPKQELTISMVGDLKNGRTVHSLSYLLSLYPKVKIIFVSPQALQMPKNIKEELTQNKVDFEETENFLESIKKSDIIYMTRIQKERFENTQDYEKYFGKYILDKKSLASIKKNTYIMHPLPRINEIAPEIDSDSRAIYFEQSQNGVYVRMAILLYLFDK